MILHLSIAARDPERVARVLAELWGGRVLPCPHPIDGGWIVFAPGAGGISVEVYPRGSDLVPGERAVATRSVKARPTSATHFAITTRLTEAKIEAIARRENWAVLRADRGPYRVLEVWLENERLVEVLTAKMAREYEASMTPEQWALVFEL